MVQYFILMVNPWIVKRPGFEPHTLVCNLRNKIYQPTPEKSCIGNIIQPMYNIQQNTGILVLQTSAFRSLCAYRCIQST